ncbi:hypothetical protein IV102_10115 [bacterium]|nr:hypothetical protein [bacterium]
MLDSEFRLAHLKAAGLAIPIDPKPPTNLRATPSGAIMSKLDGKQLLIVLKPGPWHQILTADRLAGYVHASTVSTLVLDAPAGLLEEICAPLIRERVEYCSTPPFTDRRKKSCLSLFGGPLGSLVVAPDGRVIRLEPTGWSLAGGMSQDRQWVTVRDNLVDPPRYQSDSASGPILFHQVDGVYQVVLQTL